MRDLTVQEIFDAIDSGMAEVSRRLASGELDQSGRYFTDAELATHAVFDSELHIAKPDEGISA